MALTKVKSAGVNSIPASVYNAHVPAGAILQTITSHDATASSHASVSGATPVTLMSATITPSSTSSKILIFGFLHVGGLYSNCSGRLDYIGTRLKRGSTVIGEPTSLSTLTTVHGADATGSRPMHSVVKDAGYSASRQHVVPFHFTDSPSTTSSITYNIQGVISHVSGGKTLVKNGSGYNYNNEEAHLATSNLTLQEIKG